MIIISENSKKLADEVESALDSGDTSLACSLLEDSQNYAAVKTGANELVPVISKYICAKYEAESTDIFNICVKLLEKVVETSLVDDILHQLVGLIELSDSTNFFILLNCIYKVLRRAPRENTIYLGRCVNSIQIRLNKCSVPDYGVTSVRSDNDVFHIEILYQDILRFYNLIIPFYSEQFKSNSESRIILLKYLIQLLAKPIGYMDLGLHTEKTRLRRMAEDIVRKILSICEDPFKYLGMDDEVPLKPTKFAYGMFLHFLLDENVDYEVVPRIYSSTYIFRSSLIFISKLLDSYSNYVILKGLCTLEMLLKRTPKLSHFILDLEGNKSIWEALLKVIIYNQHQEMRQRALDIFKLYLYKFEPKAQYLLLTNWIFEIDHSNVAGYLITQYKEILVELQKEHHSDLCYFEGEKMYTFIKRCCGTIDIDSILQYDKLISLLNLMRFTILQVEDTEKFKNTANIWKSEFLDRLQFSLEKLSKVINQKIFSVENDDTEANFEFDLNFEDAEMLNALSSKAEKLESLYASRTKIEITESILKRIMELLAEKNC
ncbi:uncharacterized protein LOC123674275 [Harmonia axyridis]|uniref:uncharacterized protein LOC123674275 n=1 Tax=Harmonia axyridis TaxID=115357 RepID=UPI001E275A98|nr:uncharacterized protein LOC123674275 [Harmonia axyridis]